MASGANCGHRRFAAIDYQIYWDLEERVYEMETFGGGARLGVVFVHVVTSRYQRTVGILER